MENTLVSGQNFSNSLKLPCHIQQAAEVELFRQSTQEKYNDFCKNHFITMDVKQRGEHYLQELLLLNAIEETKLDQESLFACVIYITVVESSLPYGDMDPLLFDKPLELSMTVTEILMKAKININKFFQAIHWIRGQIQLSKTVQDHLIKLETKYLVVSALFHTFESRLSTSVFKEENVTEGIDTESFLPPIPETEGVPYRKKQCWVLYLLAKKHLLSANQELFQHFQLLLCCLEFVLRQTPSFLLNAPYDSIRFGCYNHEQMTMLQKLAMDFDVSVDQTLELQKESTECYFQSLLNADGELDSERLCSDYLLIYQKDGDINEMDFLLKDSYLQPSPLKRFVTLPYLQCSSILHETMTPVKMAVCTIQQFQQSFENLPECPSEKLITYFKKCIHNPSDTVNKIINDLKVKFIKEYNVTKLAEMRFTFGVKLYYRVLEVIILNETGHLPPPVLSTLLNKESFHISLLACALEVVLITYSPTWNRDNFKTTDEPFFFPWILNIFSLQPYEFYKVIESFIKAEPRLSTDVIKHLQYIETRVLESLAWSENSILFEFFNDSEVGQKTPPLSPVKSHEGCGKNAVDLFLSPVGSHSISSASHSLQKTMLSEPAISEIGNRLSSQFKSQSLAHFLKRVLRLGFSRLSKLCSNLDISRELQHKIWTCFEYCITKAPHLLKNRHIDQIIMCCIYSICKVSDSEIKFKFIVNEYKNLPNAKQEVFRYVHIEDCKYESIINFYNSIFMINLKKYILNFHPNKDRQQLSPMPRHSPSFCLQGRKNFLISPLKDSFKTLGSPGQMTPSTRLLYSFGDSIGSSEKLKDINETVKKFGPAGAKKRLNLDDEELSSASKAKRNLCNS